MQLCSHRFNVLIVVVGVYLNIFQKLVMAGLEENDIILQVVYDLEQVLEPVHTDVHGVLPPHLAH